MNRGICLVLVLMMIGIVVGAPVNPGDKVSGDVEEIEKKIDTYIPLDETGKVDYEDAYAFLTKAEERIAGINLWLDENVGWMRYIFHMKPAVSWLFAINLYIILWFFVLLFLNAKGMWFFISEGKKAQIFGGAIFVSGMVVRLYYGLATVIHMWGLYFWHVFIDALAWMGIVAFVLLVCGFGWLGFGIIGTIGAWFTRYKLAKQKMKERVEMTSSTKAIDALVEQIGK